MEKLVLLVISVFCILGLASAQLKLGFYNAKCPKAESIIQGIVKQRFDRDKSITAALLRMHFHDCFVRVSFNFKYVGSFKFSPNFSPYNKKR